jgi:MoxR-like ATPase
VAQPTGPFHANDAGAMRDRDGIFLERTAMPLARRTPRARADGELSPARNAKPSHRSLLRPLGVVGYDAVEPVLLAALATEEPLLLVSDHGAAKTLLLVRLAEALGVELRHYNASLLQFDDLVGYPIPDERTGTVHYAAPPGAIWGAEAVFLDEIGRCRPETANKLFPIVHERRVQGIALDRLRYRWAATNPPVEALEEGRDVGYEGVELLDPALADRFAYVVPLPRFDELSEADRLAVIRGAGERVSPGAHAAVRELVEST